MGDAIDDISQPNSAIMFISIIMLNLMLSAAEAECRALLYNQNWKHLGRP